MGDVRYPGLAVGRPRRWVFHDCHSDARFVAYLAQGNAVASGIGRACELSGASPGGVIMGVFGGIVAVLLTGLTCVFWDG